jgi:hypothetical protein
MPVKKTAASEDLSINVRMYRQGLGDCFLLTFNLGGAAKYNLLIDCGLLQGTSGSTELMQDVAANIRQTLSANNAPSAVAVTHEHWDHISGFSQAKEIFDEIKFDEVWLGWTEDENHARARDLRERFNKQITGLKKALKDVAEKKGAGFKVEEMPGFFQVASSLVEDFFDEELGVKGGKGRSATWDYISKRAEPRYCSPTDVFSPKGLEGEVRVYVLGPPLDLNFFSKTEPSKKDAANETYRDKAGFALAESFFASFADNDDDPFTEACRPFEKDLATIIPHAGNHDICDDVKRTFDTYFDDDNKWRQIDDDWLMMLEPLALHLDSYTNNSCLAFAIELVKSGRVMVFPGDAQFGNWISWKDLSWKVKNSDGAIIEITTADLLARTVLYKVGHHGSHNATLKEHGLELMNSPELAAMIPVDRAKARDKKWEMPEGLLYERLLEKSRGRIIIADESDVTELKDRCKDAAFEKRVKFAEDKFGGSGKPLYVEIEIKN